MRRMLCRFGRGCNRRCFLVMDTDYRSKGQDWYDAEKITASVLTRCEGAYGKSRGWTRFDDGAQLPSIACDVQRTFQSLGGCDAQVWKVPVKPEINNRRDGSWLIFRN